MTVQSDQSALRHKLLMLLIEHDAEDPDVLARKIEALVTLTMTREEATVLYRMYRADPVTHASQRGLALLDKLKLASDKSETT